MLATREELKEIAASRANLEKTKEAALNVQKDQVKKLETDLKEKQAQYEKAADDLERQVKTSKQLQMERDKMKQRITKLKNRRFRIEDNQKICKKCGKEYLEKENYNWSCRTHQSDRGEDMWWCCGKVSKEAPGCKFSKHESKEDDEDEGNDPESKEDA